MSYIQTCMNALQATNNLGLDYIINFLILLNKSIKFLFPLIVIQHLSNKSKVQNSDKYKRKGYILNNNITKNLWFLPYKYEKNGTKVLSN